MMGFQLSGEKENVCEQSAGRGFVGVRKLTGERGEIMTRCRKTFAFFFLNSVSLYLKGRLRLLASQTFGFESCHLQYS